MFGYIRPYKSELLVREYEQYKAVYCELCRELGKSFGRTARFLLSFDCTFYAMLAISVNEEEVKLKSGRCTVNPLKKCSFIVSSGNAYHKAAALTVVMAYHKLKDDVSDEGFLKAMVARLGVFWIGRKHKKAAKAYPEIAQIVEEAMKAQSLAESSPEVSLDRSSDPTATMLSKLFEELAGANENQAYVLSQFGYFLGRWVYLIDAADDISSDLETESFNPFIKKWDLLEIASKEENGKHKRSDLGKTSLNETSLNEVHYKCNQVLNSTLSMLLPVFNLIEMGQFAPIIENVVEKGLPQIQRELLFLHIREKAKENLHD